MVIGEIAPGESFGDLTNGAQVLDALEALFRGLGASHFLATGFPLPGRPIGPLILRLQWGDLRHERGMIGGIEADDALIHVALGARRPFQWSAEDVPAVGRSVLVSELPSPAARIACFPICSFLPYQAVVIAAGDRLAIDASALLEIDHLCIGAFGRLFALGYLRRERPGELSARERRVVELSAVGKTANQIAAILEISQRTVHAHLQNASEKLQARNKTHTVVEALRYGQITI
jgi:LuxR family quorum sensing-dependent transcriptional regulator